MLLIIPCSGVKREASESAEAGASITQSLPTDLAYELLEARARVKARIPIDESTLIPAWRRYDGALYQAGREALSDFIRAGSRVVILSGGYGAILAQEPIGMYNAVLNPSWWPGRVLERSLIAYAQRHRLSSVRALCSATGPYLRILRRVSWREAGIDDALMLMPQAESEGMRRSPASQGEALAALRDGTLSLEGQSSYGLDLEIHPA